MKVRNFAIVICITILFMSLSYAGPPENILDDGSFESDQALTDSGRWNSYLNASSDALFFLDDEDKVDGAQSAFVEIKKFSGTNWHIGVTQDKVTLKAEQYTLTFWAKSEKVRKITVEAKRSPSLGAWEGIMEKDFTIQKEWEEYSYTFICPKDYKKGSAFVGFWLAETDGNVWLDFVWLYPGKYQEIKPSEGKKAITPKEKLATTWGKIKM